MSVRPVLRMGDPVLLQVAQPVERFDTPELHALLQDMKDTMAALNGAGIAAPQIGTSLQVVIFGVGKNPRYPAGRGSAVHRADQPGAGTARATTMEEGWEGCLSVPGMRGLVPRYTRLALSRLRSQGPAHRSHGGRFSRARRATRSRSPARHPLSHAHPRPAQISVSTKLCFPVSSWSTTDRSTLTFILSRSILMAAAPQSTLSLRDPSLFRQQAFVGGRWVDAASGEVKQVLNPANGQLIGTVPNMRRQGSARSDRSRR